MCVRVKLLQSCPTLCNPMDHSLVGFSVHGILQARILKWIAMPSSQGIFPSQESNPCLLGLLHWETGSLPLVPLGMPNVYVNGIKIIHPSGSTSKLKVLFVKVIELA